MSYTEHNDAKGRDSRVRVATHNAERARREQLQREADAFSITLYMSKYELQARCRESAYVGTSQRS